MWAPRKMGKHARTLAVVVGLSRVFGRAVVLSIGLVEVLLVVVALLAAGLRHRFGGGRLGGGDGLLRDEIVFAVLAVEEQGVPVVDADPVATFHG